MESDVSVIKEIIIGQCFAVNGLEKKIIGILTCGIFTCSAVVVSENNFLLMGHIYENYNFYKDIENFICNSIIPSNKNKIKIVFTEGQKASLNKKINYSQYFLNIKEKIEKAYNLEVELKPAIKHDNPINILKINNRSYYDGIKKKMIKYYDNRIKYSIALVKPKFKELKTQFLSNCLDEELIFLDFIPNEKSKSLLKELKIYIEK